jgi:hypothetical protein
VSVIDTIACADLLEGVVGRERFFEEDNIVTVVVGLSAEAGWRLVDDGPHGILAADDRQKFEPEGPGQSGFDPGGQGRLILLVRAENDVPTLNVAAHVVETERLKARPELRHLEQVLAADVDAAK